MAAKRKSSGAGVKTGKSASNLAPPDPKQIEAAQAELGADYEFTGVSEAGLGTFQHRPTGERFIWIPGGVCSLGFTLDDLFFVFQALTKAERTQVLEGSYPSEICAARPARQVSFRDFLMSERPVTRGSRQECEQVCEPKGWRLPSEAEWEFVAREGGRATWTCVQLSGELTPKLRKK